jgi:membrane associated rhomboid family serine protease
MQELSAPGTIGLIILTVLVSLNGFRDRAFCERNLFSVYEILAGKEYRRLVTSAFLHADLAHLTLNMVSLYLFGQYIEAAVGIGQFLVIYFAAVIGGDLLALWLHRHHEYRAYGASGGVCGVIFSYVLLFPDSGISFFMLPFWIPGWLYAILYLAGSFFALKSQLGNIGHDAHIGGAVIGLWITALLVPAAARQHLNIFLGISAVGALGCVYLFKNPMLLPLRSFLPSGSNRSQSRQHSKPIKESAEIDAILEKIGREGIHSLTPREAALLKSTSEKYQRRADSQKPQSDLII